MKKVLVIGSNSFSGSDFIDLLLEKGEYEVTGISRSREKDALFLPYRAKNSPHFTFEQIDLNQDLDKLDSLLEAFEPEYIVNFAAQSEVGPSWENPDHWFQTNAVALTSLANLLKDKKFLKKYVHISSPEVYGTCEGFIKEDTPVNPSTPYAASKAAIEGFTRSLSLEVASRGITVNAVAPGFIKTEILDSIDPEKLETMAKSIPMGRIGDVRDISNIVSFLASDESSYITGQVLHVNGGLTL